MTPANGMYFNTCKSVHIDGNARYYWMLQQDIGHLIQMSEPFDDMDDCLRDMSTNGLKAYEYWKNEGGLK